MSKIRVINGDLLEAKEKYIVHQCNCCTWVAAHLAKSVFEKFPYANIYAPRKNVIPPRIDEPGTIIVKGNGVNQRFVIALLGQYFPGTPRRNQQALDSYSRRARYFQSGLEHIAKIPELESVAFADHVGCGAAGGDWNLYRTMIDDFADNVPGADVVIYKLARI